MITSYEVGAIFKVADQATPTLTRLTQAARDLADSAMIARREVAALGRMPGVTALSRQFGGLARNANAAAAAMGTATAAARRFTASGVPAILQGGGGGAGGGGGVPVPGRRPYPHRGGGWHVSGIGAGIPGGPHAYFRGGSNAMLFGAGALAYGVYEESELEDATARMMLTIPGAAEDTALSTARRAQIRQLLQSMASRTGAPLHDLEEAILTGVRQFAGMPFEKRMEVMPSLLEAAAGEAKLKGRGTTVEQAMESMTGLAHMFQAYDPPAIAKLANAFAYISAVDPEKLPQIERAASYVIPRTRGLEIDPLEQLLLVGVMQRAGVRSSKAGTWISAMMTRALPGTSLMSRQAFRKHEFALREMGLIDDKHQPTWFTDGKPDPIKMLSIASEHAQRIPLIQRQAIEQQLFGTQGAGGFGLLADPVVFQQIRALQGELPGFKGGMRIFDDLQKTSPVQQARQAWADTRNVLIDIGAVVLPPLLTGLQAFDTLLRGLKGILPTGPGPARPSFLQGLNAAFGRGMAKGTVPGAIIGGIGGGVFGLGGGALPGAFLGGAIGAVIGGGYEAGKYMLGSAFGTPAAAAVAPAMPGVTGVPAATIPGGAGLTLNVNVKAETDRPEALAHAVTEMIVDNLHTSGLFNQGEGHGTLDSAATSGVPVP